MKKPKITKEWVETYKKLIIGENISDKQNQKSLDKKKSKTTEGKGIKTTEIELLRQEIAMLKNALCTCPNNGTFVGCPIHGEKMYGDEWRFIDHKKL